MSAFLSKLHVLITFLTLLSLSQLGHAQNQAPKPLNLPEIAKSFHTTMVQCPEKIWPDYSWKDTYLFLVEPSKKQAQMLKGDSTNLIVISASQLPDRAQTSTYDFFMHEGRYATSLNIEEISRWGSDINKQTFTLGVHEFFHFLGQKDWQRKAGGNRGNLYPLDPRPRIYRRMLFDNLKVYFMSSGANKESLNKASFWFNKWKNENPKEVTDATDGYEGTAKYVDTAAQPLALRGCQATDQVLIEDLKILVNSEMGYSVSGDRMALDSEGYEIGGLSGLILRFIENDPRWYQDAKNGITPLESLLTTIPPIQESVPRDIQQKFINKAAEENKKLGDVVDADLSRIKNSQFVRVKAPSSALTSNYSPLAFLSVAALPDYRITPMQSSLLFKNATSSLSIKEKAVFFTKESDPCNDGSWIVLVNKTDIQQTGDVMNVTSPLAEGKITGEMKTDSDGNQWLCWK